MIDLINTIIDNRYQVQRLIAEGGMSSVYCAHRVHSPLDRVAIKVLHGDCVSQRIEDIIRFRNEVRITMRCDHPHIVKIIDVGEFFKLQYIVMEYVDGRNLKDVIDAQTLTFDQALDIVMQICDGLAAIHERGVIHQDITPANIIIRNETAVIIDFGVARLKEYPAPGNAALTVGTFAYMSPEQCGILSRVPDARSDLYSLGVIMYQLFSGELPFPDENLFELLNRHMSSSPTPHFPDRTSLPPVVDDIIRKLMARDPDSRYQSAQGLYHDLAKVRQKQYHFPLGLADYMPGSLPCWPFAGRETELSRLQAGISMVSNRVGGFIVVQGPAGCGKTRLVQEALLGGADPKPVILGTQGNQLDRSVPYAVIRELIDRYLLLYRAYPDAKKAEVQNQLVQAFFDQGEALLRLNPHIKEILNDCAPLVPLEPAAADKRFQVAASSFLLQLAELEAGMVLIVDDLQWIDAGSAGIIAMLAGDISRRPLLLLATMRIDDIDTESPAAGLMRMVSGKQGCIDHMAMQNLDTETIRDIVSQIFSLPEAETARFADFLYGRSRGNPLFLREFIRQLAEMRIVVTGKSDSRIDWKRLDCVEPPSTVIEIIRDRIVRLSPAEREVLSAAAVIGKEFDFSILSSVSDYDHDRLVVIIDTALDLQLIEYSGHLKRRIRFVHPHIREALYDLTGDDRRRDLHGRILDVLEQTREVDPVSIFELAYHAIQLGDHNRAIDYSYQAGHAAREAHAHDDALYYFQMVIDLSERIDPGDARGVTLKEECRRGMAEIYSAIGKNEQAIVLFTQLLTNEKTATGKARFCQRISRAYSNLGEFKQSEDWARTGLAYMGQSLPRYRIGFILGICSELSIHAIRRRLSRLFSSAPDARMRERFAIIISLYNSLEWAFILNDPLRYVHIVLYLLNRTEQWTGESLELADCYSTYAILCSYLALFQRSLRYHRMSMDISRKLNSPFSLAESYLRLGICNEWMGRYSNAIKLYEQGAALFERIGASQEYMQCCRGISICYRRMADYPNALVYFDRYHTIARKIHDDYGIINSLYIAANISIHQGDLDRADVLIQQAETCDPGVNQHFMRTLLHILKGSVNLQRGLLDAALEEYQKARRLCRANRFIPEYTVQVYSGHAEVLCALHVRDQRQRDARLSERSLKKIKRACREALVRTKKWNTHYGASLRVAAQYHALCGNRKKAVMYFNKSIAHCRSFHRVYEEAVSLYEYALFLHSEKAGDEWLAPLEEALHLFTVVESALFIRKISNLLGVRSFRSPETPLRQLVDAKAMHVLSMLEHDLAAADDSRSFYRKLMETISGILGGQRGFLFAVEHGAPCLRYYYTTTGEDKREYSMYILEQVLATGKTLITTNAQMDCSVNTSYSIALYGLKAVLCIPVSHHGRIIALCYIDNPVSAGIFSEADAERIFNFFSALSGLIERMMEIPEPPLVSVPDSVVAMNKALTDKMEKAKQFIDEYFRSDISREGLAASLDMHPDHLSRYFKIYAGMPMITYLNQLRIREASRLLLADEREIRDIAASVGFTTTRSFNRVFRESMNMSPARYRKLHS